MFEKKDFEKLRSMADIYDLSPFDFEWFCKFYLERAGYQSAFVTQKHGDKKGDGGIDVTCVRDGHKVLVQCKKWRFGFRGHMTIAPIRELGGCMLRDKVPLGIFMGLLPYDSLSKNEAAKMNIMLIDAEDIGRAMHSWNPAFSPKTRRGFVQRLWRGFFQMLRMVVGM